MSKQRKVSFYRLSIVLKRQNPKGEIIRERLSESDTASIFMAIYEHKMKAIGNGRKAIGIESLNRRFTMEVMSIHDNVVFAKFGRSNSANTVNLRDNETLKAESVPMTASQQLELFTYCLYDLNTGIISYIGINGAPKISALKHLFEGNISENQLVYLDSILTDDILEKLSKKSVIGKITYSVAVPPDDILSARLDLNRREFDEFRNIKRTSVEYEIVAKRNKNMFVASSYFLNLISKVKEKHGDAIRNIHIRAKDHNEPMQTYNLLNYNLTKMVDLDVDKNEDLLDENDFYAALKYAYESSKAEIERYIR